MQVRLGAAQVEVDEQSHPQYPDYWHAVDRGDWEPQTISTICSVLVPGSRFVDVGAWIGPTSLAAAAAGATVDAFEPDPIARERLLANLALNPDLQRRITVHPLALGDRDQEAVIRSLHLGNSGSSLLYNSGEGALTQVADGGRVARAQDWAHADLIKIDIEGGEYALIPRIVRVLREGKPTLLLSTHMEFARRNLPESCGRVRRVVALTAQAARHQLLLLWRLRFYSRWSVEDGGQWRYVGRIGAARLLAVPANRDFLLQS